MGIQTMESTDDNNDDTDVLCMQVTLDNNLPR